MLRSNCVMLWPWPHRSLRRLYMILFLSGDTARAIKRIGDELKGIKDELREQRAWLERIANAIESTPDETPREPTSVEFNVSTPEQE